MKKSKIITVIDIGTSKTSCAVVKYNRAYNSIDVISVACKMSKGVKSGQIIDFNQASTVIYEVLGAAQSEIEYDIDNIILSISGGKIISEILKTNMNLDHHGRIIQQKDVNYLIKSLLSKIDTEKFEIIHYIPVEFNINDISSINNPVGMTAENLGVALNVILVPSAIIRNINNCFVKCHVNVDDIVISSYASSLAVLTQEEREHGALLVEIGYDATSIALYDSGYIKNIDMIEIGSNHISRDISIAFGIGHKQAERIKTLYANLDPDDENSYIDLSDFDEEVQKKLITHKELLTVISARVDEIIELVLHKVQSKKIDYISDIVVTGGGANMVGISNYLQTKLGISVRVGIPEFIMPVHNAESLLNPSFSVLVGLINYAIKKKLMVDNYQISGPGITSKISNWVQTALRKIS